MKKYVKLPLKMMLPLLISLCFVAYSTAEINIATRKDVNLNLTIGNYTEYTVTSCKMRCAYHSNCASIALKELPNTGLRPFVCYLMQNDTYAKENGTIRNEVEIEKMMVVDKVEKFEDDEKRNQTKCRSDTVKPSSPPSTEKPVFTKTSLSIERDQKLVTLNHLYKSYNLTFELYLNKNQEAKLTSIIHMTIGGSYGQYGDRTPVIFLGSDHKLSIASAVNGNVNFNWSPHLVLQKERWYKITVSQLKEGNSPSFIYRIEIDGQTMFAIENNDARDFDGVSLYASVPWYTPANAKIRNLALHTSQT